MGTELNSGYDNEFEKDWTAIKINSNDNNNDNYPTA